MVVEEGIHILGDIRQEDGLSRNPSLAGPFKVPIHPSVVPWAAQGGLQNLELVITGTESLVSRDLARILPIVLGGRVRELGDLVGREQERLAADGFMGSTCLVAICVIVVLPLDVVEVAVGIAGLVIVATLLTDITEVAVGLHILVVVGTSEVAVGLHVLVVGLRGLVVVVAPLVVDTVEVAVGLRILVVGLHELVVLV